MKKLFIVSFFIFFTAFIGCGKENASIDNVSEPFEEEIEYSNIDLSAIEASVGEDNSLDAYYAVVHKTFDITRKSNEVGGGYNLVLDGKRASYLMKHLFNEISDCYDEVEIINKEGDKSTIIHRREERNQVWVLGKCANVNMRLEIGDKAGEERTYFVAKIIDENGEIVNQISLKSLTDEYKESLIPYYPVLDIDGNLHLLVEYASHLIYYIFSPDSEVLFSKTLDDNVVIKSIDILSDGKVVLLAKKLETGKKIEQIDYSVLSFDGFELKLVYEYSVPFINEPYICLKDSENIIMADDTGVYLCNKDFSDKEEIYLWMNHGIRADEIVDLCEQGEGIGVIYRKSDLYNYVYLEPVTEKKEVKQIALAVYGSSYSYYKEAVTLFNKLYPNYNIQLKGYSPDDTLLLTELNSGEGPVLIDTSITGFEDKKKLWEPLDKVIEGLDYYEQLNSKALELGKIDGHIYGIVTEFFLATLYCNDGSISDWNYNEFIETAEKEEYKYVMSSYNPGDDMLRAVENFFIHGLNDNYFIDATNNSNIFKSDEFEEMVRLIKEKVSGNEFIEPKMENGILCTRIDLTRPSDLYGYMSAIGKEAEFVGYPHKEGAYAIITGGSPLVIRKNATLEEKEIACAFINILLSYENQNEKVKKSDSAFSIRNDVIAEQIKAFRESFINIQGFGDVKINRDISNEEVLEKLNEILYKSKVGNYYPRELNEIFIEELCDYFDGLITVDELADHLDNRVSLYLSEKK